MMHENTGRHLDLSEHITQSVRDILYTRIGTRVMREDYGSLLPDLLDQPVTPALRLRLATAVMTALARWEPRIVVTAVNIDSDAADHGSRLRLIITAAVNGRAETFIIAERS